MEKLTQTIGRLSYAQVLVEIDASKELIRTVEMILPTGKLRVQSVVYEHKLKFCATCKMFGHMTAVCNSKKLAGKQSQNVEANGMLTQAGKQSQNAVEGKSQAVVAKIIHNSLTGTTVGRTD